MGTELDETLLPAAETVEQVHAGNVHPELLSGESRETVHDHFPELEFVQVNVREGLHGIVAHPLPVEGVSGAKTRPEEHVERNDQRHTSVQHAEGKEPEQPDERPLHPGRSVRGPLPTFMSVISQPAIR